MYLKMGDEIASKGEIDKGHFHPDASRMWNEAGNLLECSVGKRE